MMRRVAIVIGLSALNCLSRRIYAQDPAWRSSELDSVWQWSAPVPTIPNRRAFLWVPPECRHVREMVVWLQNMLEEPLFERTSFRTACAENDLAIMLIISGHDSVPADGKDLYHRLRSDLDIFLNPDFPKGPENAQATRTDLQMLLNRFADESGYPELAQAPLMPIRHSFADSFVWHLYQWNPDRIFVLMAFKTGLTDQVPAGVRQKQPDALFGMFGDLDAGYRNFTDDSIKVVLMFLRKIVAARIPLDTPVGQTMKLNPLDLASGWLIDPANLEKASVKPVAYRQWPEDPNDALRYTDRERAKTIQQHMATEYAKQPQQINFVRVDASLPTTEGTFSLLPQYLDDLGTFRLKASYIDHLDDDLYPMGTKLGHGNSPIQQFWITNAGDVVPVDGTERPAPPASR